MRKWLACAAPLLGMALIFAATTASGQRGRNGGGRRSQRPPALKEGDLAPDFELPILKASTNAEGKEINIITDEKIKLSSFRGKKLVCLFFSSYT